MYIHKIAYASEFIEYVIVCAYIYMYYVCYFMLRIYGREFTRATFSFELQMSLDFNTLQILYYPQITSWLPQPA